MKKEKKEKKVKTADERIKSTRELMLVEIILSALIVFVIQINGMAKANIYPTEIFIAEGLMVAVGVLLIAVLNQKVIKKPTLLLTLLTITQFVTIFISYLSSRAFSNKVYFNIPEENAVFASLADSAGGFMFFLTIILFVVVLIKNEKCRKLFKDEIQAKKQAKKAAKAEAKQTRLAEKEERVKQAQELREKRDYERLQAKYASKAENTNGNVQTTLSKVEIEAKLAEMKAEEAKEKAELKKQKQAAHKPTEKIKLYPIIVAAVSAVVIFIFGCFGVSFKMNKFTGLLYFVVPILAFSIVLLGLYFTRYFKKYYKLFGILPIVGGIILFIVATMGDSSFWGRQLVATITPIASKKLNIVVYFELLSSFVASRNNMIIISPIAAYASLMSISLYLGTLVYFLYPSKLFERVIPKVAFEKDSLQRYLVSLLIVLVWPLVLVLLIVAGIKYYNLKIAEKVKAEHSVGLAENNPNGAVIFANVEEADVVVEGSILYVHVKGEKYIAPVFYHSTGYFEDKNSNIYYFKDNKVIVTGLFRPDTMTSYDADKEAQTACEI